MDNLEPGPAGADCRPPPGDWRDWTYHHDDPPRHHPMKVGPSAHRRGLRRYDRTTLSLPETILPRPSAAFNLVISVPYSFTPGTRLRIHIVSTRGATGAAGGGAVRVSWWLTMLLHRFPSETPFEQRMRLNQFDYVRASEHAVVHHPRPFALAGVCSTLGR